MHTRPLRVALVAEESAGVQVLRGLAALRPAPELVAVLTTTDLEGGRPVVHESAQALGLDVWPAASVRTPELAAHIQRMQIDLLLNVHSLHVVHPEVIAAVRIGAFNLHPGPLPEYAGLNVPSWAIYNGEPAHGVTLHWMDDGIDTGPIAWNERFELEEADTALAVSGKCVRLGVPLVLKLATAAHEDASSIPRVEQDPARRRYFPAGPPSDWRVDWSRPSTEILRFVRAADYGPFESPWGHPQAVLDGRLVGIAKAAATEVRTAGAPGTVQGVTERGAVVATGEEPILVQRLWLDGRYCRPSELLAD